MINQFLKLAAVAVRCKTFGKGLTLDAHCVKLCYSKVLRFKPELFGDLLKPIYWDITVLVQ